MWPRRHALRALGASLAAPALPALAQFRVDISGVGATQIPIAIGRFRGEDVLPQQLSAIVRADLANCGMFKIVDGPTPADENGSPDYNALRARGADAVASGSATRLADGTIDVRFRLWDVVKGADQGGQSEPVPLADLRLAAHHVSDKIYEKLTGDRGVFSTRIAFVTHAGGKYTLFATDADGENKQAIRVSYDAIISPAWSPNGREIAYVSFEDKRKAVLYIQNIPAHTDRVLANFRGSNSSPSFSPDGSKLTVTLSKEGGSHVFLINRDGSNPVRITQSSAIDTEAHFAPDGRTIFFVSDRGGGPQIYRQSISGGNAERVTFDGSYNVSPAPSPDGKLLAYVSRQGGAFKLMVMDLASGTSRGITDTSYDMNPSFAPNSRFLVYSTKVDGRDSLIRTTTDGHFKTVLGEAGTEYREPVWGPYGR
ncbi:MAG: Tol-Pal system beta propeller repeat protein TolB [Burkholderiaceae bacterium]